MLFKGLIERNYERLHCLVSIDKFRKFDQKIDLGPVFDFLSALSSIKSAYIKLFLNPQKAHAPQNVQTHSNSLSAKSTNCLSVFDLFCGVGASRVK